MGRISCSTGEVTENLPTSQRPVPLSPRHPGVIIGLPVPASGGMAALINFSSERAF